MNNKEIYIGSTEEGADIQKDTEPIRGEEQSQKGEGSELTEGQIEMAREEMKIKFEDVRGSGESFITKEELERNQENRKDRDMLIAGAFGLGAVGIYGAAGYFGVNPENMALASDAGKIFFGSIGAMTFMVASPIARIQNWLERRKNKEK